MSRKHVMGAIDASLKRLGTDYVDLCQMHHWDPNTPILEALEALDTIARRGKARHVGGRAHRRRAADAGLALHSRRGRRALPGALMKPPRIRDSGGLRPVAAEAGPLPADLKAKLDDLTHEWRAVDAER